MHKRGNSWGERTEPLLVPGGKPLSRKGKRREQTWLKKKGGAPTPASGVGSREGQNSRAERLQELKGTL